LLAARHKVQTAHHMPAHANRRNPSEIAILL
jgi:hypothetical protein